MVAAVTTLGLVTPMSVPAAPAATQVNEVTKWNRIAAENAAHIPTSGEGGSLAPSD